jgi:hypothetical protein
MSVPGRTIRECRIRGLGRLSGRVRCARRDRQPQWRLRTQSRHGQAGPAAPKLRDVISVGAIFWALKVSYVIVETAIIPLNLAAVPGRPRREAVQRLQVRWWSWPTTPGRTAPERSVRRTLRYADLAETTVRTCQDRQRPRGSSGRAIRRWWRC